MAVLCKYDTFENETEMDKLIKKFQDRSIEFMKNQAPWEEIESYPIKDN